MYRSLLLALSLLFITIASKAAVFIVTSNADSGPGTLREALTLAAANGSAEKDYINFNLPDLSEAGRTITVQTQLPNVSSNLVIDGTTQAGSKFGVSDAKVGISVNRAAFINQILMTAAALNLNQVTDVEIYGVLISNFYFLGANDSTDAGILIANSKNIQIGSSGKGNWINNCNYFILAQTDPTVGPINQCDNIKIQSNYLGYEISTLSYAPDGIGISATNVLIGGDTPADGNHIATALNTNGDHLKISNNIIGIDGKGDESKYYLPTFQINGATDVEISYNVSVILRMVLNGLTNFNVYANRDVATDPPFALGAINIYNCTDGTIGSEDENLRNVFLTNTGSTVDQITSTLINSSSKNIQILKNEIVCSRMAYTIVLDPRDNIIIPKIQVVINNENEYSGLASPLSDIYIYYDDSGCPVCSPLKFYTKIKAGADGKWKITGNFAGKRWVSSALLLKNSSEFTQPIFSYNGDYYSTANPSCGLNNGTITLIESKYKNIINFIWYNAKDEKVGEGSELKNAAPGTYYAKGFNGQCYAQTQQIVLYDATPKISVDNLKTIDPACGKNGAISGLALILNSNNALTMSWKDQDNKEVGNQTDVDGLNAGKYTFTVTDEVTKCSSSSYGPIVLKNTTGPTIDDSKPIIVNTTCGQTTGSIKNIIVTGGTGTRHFTWKNNLQQEVAYTEDLTGQPSGKYTLQVTDDTQCGPVYSKEIEIAEVNGISLTESTTPTTPASCGKANGAVSGVTATGGVKYEWRDVNGNLVGNSLDLTNVPGGGYQLTVSNAFCQKQSKVYQVLEQSGTVFPTTYTVNHIDACYGVSDGALQVNQDLLIKAVRWVNSAGVDVGMHNGVTGLPVGSYKLYLTDQNGCESYYNTYQVGQLPEYTVADDGQINNEICGLKNGNVQNVIIIGGLPPYTYKWLNANGEQIGSTNSISNLAAGVYTLNVVDSRCGNVDITYTIQSITQDLPAPSVSDLQVCSPGDALFFVNSPASNGVYRLYDQLNSTSPLAEQAGGSFKIDVTNNRSFFVSQVNGTCESARSEVKVSVGLSTINIANTFSPNGDGHNDYWKIDGIENYPQAVVQIFNRNGQKLFESKGYGTPFNGTYKGKPLPTGTYFYIINLNKNCNLLSGSLTIIR